MDTYTKGVLTVIAIALVSITFQLSGTQSIKNAHAEIDFDNPVLPEKVHKIAICDKFGNDCLGIRQVGGHNLLGIYNYGN